MPVIQDFVLEGRPIPQSWAIHVFAQHSTEDVALQRYIGKVRFLQWSLLRLVTNGQTLRCKPCNKPLDIQPCFVVFCALLGAATVILLVVRLPLNMQQRCCNLLDIGIHWILTLPPDPYVLPAYFGSILNLFLHLFSKPPCFMCQYQGGKSKNYQFKQSSIHPFGDILHHHRRQGYTHRRFKLGIVLDWAYHIVVEGNYGLVSLVKFQPLHCNDQTLRNLIQ